MSRSPGKAAERSWSLSSRVMTGQAVVFLAMAGVIILTGLLVGPPIFDDHMRRTGHGDQPLVLQHAAEAFRAAGLISLAVGLTIASLGAVVVSLLVTRRIAVPLEAFARASRHVAAGRYHASGDVVGPAPGDLGEAAGGGGDEDVGHGAGRAAVPVSAHGIRELEELANGFNDMAARLAETETVRRRMLADLAHEMRTPLASISVLLEAWEDGMAPDQPTLIATLRRQTARLEDLTRDIKAVSDADEQRLSLAVAPTTIAAVLRRTEAAFRVHADQQQVHLGIAADADLDTALVVDEHRIAQVLDNLVANALRHTPAGGSVTLDAAPGMGAGVVSISVRDTGDGIAPDHLPHVFDRFYRTDTARDRDHGGSGIGLTISHAIAQAHHGSLTAASEGAGMGAVFTLELPTV